MFIFLFPFHTVTGTTRKSTILSPTLLVATTFGCRTSVAFFLSTLAAPCSSGWCLMLQCMVEYLSNCAFELHSTSAAKVIPIEALKVILRHDFCSPSVGLRGSLADLGCHGLLHILYLVLVVLGFYSSIGCCFFGFETSWRCVAFTIGVSFYWPFLLFIWDWFPCTCFWSKLWLHNRLAIFKPYSGRRMFLMVQFLVLIRSVNFYHPLIFFLHFIEAEVSNFRTS